MVCVLAVAEIRDKLVKRLDSVTSEGLSSGGEVSWEAGDQGRWENDLCCL